MKTVKQITALGAMFLWAVCGSVFAQQPAVGQNCDLQFRICPEEFDGQVITVPPRVISLSANIRACDVEEVFEGTESIGTPPAVMFVVDHTGSMTGNNGHDPDGNRFRVMRDLIDSIYDVYKDAKVGFILFGPGLTFGPDSARDPNLVRFNGVLNVATDSSSYFPLMPLNGPVLPSGGLNGGANRGFSSTATTAIELYRDMFHIPPLTNPANTRRAGVLRTPARTTGGADFRNIVVEQSGTNISIAFEAALEAFARDDASDKPTPKENRYIIFISDGDPSPNSCGGSANARCAMQYDFVFGENTPTTYTVFLNRLNQRNNLPHPLDTIRAIQRGQGNNTNMYNILNIARPADGIPANRFPTGVTIPGMTHNIRNNGYSSNNHLSNVWLLAANRDSMLALMMENIINPMLTQADGKPTRMVIKSNTGDPQSTETIGTNGFSFTRPLGLNVGDSTTVEMSVTYNVTIVEEIDGIETVICDNCDTTRTFSFTVIRDENALEPGQNAGYGIGNCKQKPIISLYYDGSSVDTVKEFMSQLKVVFNAYDNDYDEVKVYVMNAMGDIDTVKLDLKKSGNTWSEDFSRIVADMIAGDDVLQHRNQDSIIVVFRNPYVPLDTARIAIPYISTYIAFYDKPGNPAGPPALTPLIPEGNTTNTINVTAGFTQDIYAKFFGPDGGWLKEYEDGDMASKISWSTNAPGNALSQTTGIFTTFTTTAVTTGDNVYEVTATFEHGEMIITRTILIKIDPIKMALYGALGNPAGPPVMTPFPASTPSNPDNTVTVPLVAGLTLNIFAKLFEINDAWIQAYETDSVLMSKIKWSVVDPPAPATITPNVGNTTEFRSTVVTNSPYRVTAELTLDGFTTFASMLIKLEPAAAKHLDIVSDTVNVRISTENSKFNEVTLDNDQPSVQVWAVERDEFGNFVRFSPNAVFSVKGGNDSRVSVTTNGDGSAIISRGKGAGNEIYVTASGANEQGTALEPNEDIHVIVIGEALVSIGPNPFAPGKNTLGELPPKVLEYYEPILKAYNAGTGTSGILIAVESPRPLKKGTSLRIMIYDAVGNVVVNTTSKGSLSDSNTHGFIWDGKNHRGRAVGPGTYLMKVSGVQDDGKKFAPPAKKLGVTRAGKVK